MYNTLSVNISQRTSQLGHPKLESFLGKGFSGDVEAQVSSCHQVDHNVPVSLSHCLISRDIHAQVFDVLKREAQVAQEGMVEVLQHPSLANDIAHAL